MPKTIANQSREAAVARWQSKVTYYEPEGWLQGVAVNVSSARTRGKKGLAFTYLRHVKNNESGSEWIDCYDKQDKLWSFPLDCVTIKLVKPKRKYTRRTNA